MSAKILYNDINLPKKVSDILELDFWILQHVSPQMVKTVTNPVKFSAFTSIFVHRGEGEADLNLVSKKIKAPCVINIFADDIVLPKYISEDFDASFVVLSKRLDTAISTTIRDVGIFSLIHRHPILNLGEKSVFALERLYDDLKNLVSDSNCSYPFQSILHSILSYFYRYTINQYEIFRQNMPASLNNRIADKFIRMVQEYFKKERFLDFYAEELGITPKHLSRTVKLQTGIPAVDWINRYVILEAKVMLRSSNLNIQQIAEELNFPSQSVFGKYFKKATGITPKEYRNSFS